MLDFVRWRLTWRDEMNVTPEIRNMVSAVFAANKSGTFQTFKTIKIQMGWKAARGG